MKNRDMPTGTNASIGKMIDGVEVFSSSDGLTKLETAAIAAMQGLLVSTTKDSVTSIPKAAVSIANALFDELEKDQ